MPYNIVVQDKASAENKQRQGEKMETTIQQYNRERRQELAAFRRRIPQTARELAAEYGLPADAATLAMVQRILAEDMC